jgi:hypothetical protein
MIFHLALAQKLHLTTDLKRWKRTVSFMPLVCPNSTTSGNQRQKGSNPNL